MGDIFFRSVGPDAFRPRALQLHLLTAGSKLRHLRRTSRSLLLPVSHLSLCFCHLGGRGKRNMYDHHERFSPPKEWKQQTIYVRSIRDHSKHSISYHDHVLPKADMTPPPPGLLCLSNAAEPPWGAGYENLIFSIGKHGKLWNPSIDCDLAQIKLVHFKMFGTPKGLFSLAAIICYHSCIPLQIAVPSTIKDRFYFLAWQLDSIFVSNLNHAHVISVKFNTCNLNSKMFLCNDPMLRIFFVGIIGCKTPECRTGCIQICKDFGFTLWEANCSATNCGWFPQLWRNTTWDFSEAFIKMSHESHLSWIMNQKNSLLYPHLYGKHWQALLVFQFWSYVHFPALHQSRTTGGWVLRRFNTPCCSCGCRSSRRVTWAPGTTQRGKGAGGKSSSKP